MRSHGQCNTTLYWRSDRYRGVFGQRDAVFMNQRELERRGLRPSERVDTAVLRRSMWRASDCASCKSSARLNRCRRGRQYEARLVRSLRSVAGVGVAHLANTRKQ
jgi:hypothetical protein